MATVHNIKGTSVSSFQIGKGGPTLTATAGVLELRDGQTFRILDSTNTDSIGLSHDGINFNTVFVNTLDWNITGLTGDLRIDHSVYITHSADATNDHAFEIDCLVGGFGDVKAIDIDYVTGAIANGTDEAVILLNIDATSSLGGDVSGIEILATEGAVGRITGLLAGAGVGPIEQLSGVFVNADTILDIAVNETVALSTGGAGNIAIFTNDDETLTISSAAKFEEIEFIFDTAASGAGIAPTFEYSTGVDTWASFVPVDGTNGLRNTGVIAWLDSDIPAWAIGTGSEFLIRITRTRNNLTTTPIVDKIQVVAAVEYFWDDVGDVAIRSLAASGAITALSYDGVLAANLLDKTAPETITGAYKFTTDVLLEAPTNGIIGLKVLEAGTGDVGAILEYDGAANVFNIKVGNNPPITRMSINRDTGVVAIATSLTAASSVTAASVQAGNGTPSAGRTFNVVSAGIVSATFDGTNVDGNVIDIVGAVGANNSYGIRFRSAVSGFAFAGWDVSEAHFKIGADRIGAGWFTVNGSGTSVGVLTATSYGGILEANLLDKNATETISGLFTFTGEIISSRATPLIRFIETDAVADNQKWEMLAVAGQLRFRTSNDAGTISSNWLTVDRTGTTIDNVNIPAPLTAVSYDGVLAANLLDKTVNENVSGLWNFSGPGGQRVLFNSTSANGAYVTFQRSGTSLVDVGNAAQVFSGGRIDDFGITTRSSSDAIQLGTGGIIRMTIAGTGVANFQGALDIGLGSQFGGGYTPTDAAIVARAGSNVLIGVLGQTSPTLIVQNALVTVLGNLAATNIGGILQANLLDKSADETISGTYRHTSTLRINMANGSIRANDNTQNLAIIFGDDFDGSVNPIIRGWGGTSSVSAKLLQVLVPTVGGSIVIGGSGGDAPVDITGPLTATSYDGVLAANLLDKSATETVSGAYKFTNGSGIQIDNAFPFVSFNETDAAAENRRWFFGATGNGDFIFQTATDAGLAAGRIMTVARTGTVVDSVAFSAPLTATSYDGVLAANLLDKTGNETVSGIYTFSHSNGVTISSLNPQTVYFETNGPLDEKRWRFLIDGGQLRLQTVNDAFVTTANIFTIDRTGIVVDAFNVFAPLTATSFGGILSANLLDKTATEAITGAWRFDDTIRILGDTTAGTPPQDTSNIVASLEFWDSDNTDKIGELFMTGGDIELRNFQEGGFLFLRGTSLAAGNQTFLTGNPAGATTLHHGASGIAHITTQPHSTTGNTSAAQVKDGGNFFRDIGYNVLPKFNDNVSDTIEARHSGQVAFKDATTARTLTLAAVGALDFPVDGMTTVINAFTSGNYTITEGASTTLYYLDGATRIDTNGGATLGPGGVANIWREAAGVYYIWGTGITP